MRAGAACMHGVCSIKVGCQRGVQAQQMSLFKELSKPIGTVAWHGMLAWAVC